MFVPFLTAAVVLNSTARIFVGLDGWAAGTTQVILHPAGGRSTSAVGINNATYDDLEPSHYGVQLTAEEKDRMGCWIDLLVPDIAFPVGRMQKDWVIMPAVIVLIILSFNYYISVAQSLRRNGRDQPGRGGDFLRDRSAGQILARYTVVGMDGSLRPQ